VLFKAGDTLPISVPPVIAAMLPAARDGIPLVIAGGQTGSIARLESSGAVTPVIRIGDRLPDGKSYRGSRRSQARTMPGGRIVFAQDLFAIDSGIYMWIDGRMEAVLRAPLIDESGAGRSAPSVLEVNRNGDIVFQLGFGCCGIWRMRDGRVTRVSENNDPTVDGIMFFGFASAPAIDESGRVAFRLSKAAGERPDYLSVWDDSGAHIVLAPGQRMPDGSIASGAEPPKGCADGFVVGMLGTLALYRNNNWEYLAERSARLATGQPANSINGFEADVNHACDTVFRAEGHIGARTGNKFHQIHNLGDLTPDGDLLIAVIQLLINDDGTLFVLGANDRGEEVIYRATPLQ